MGPSLMLWTRREGWWQLMSFLNLRSSATLPQKICESSRFAQGGNSCKAPKRQESASLDAVIAVAITSSVIESAPHARRVKRLGSQWYARMEPDRYDLNTASTLGSEQGARVLLLMMLLGTQLTRDLATSPKWLVMLLSRRTSTTGPVLPSLVHPTKMPYCGRVT